MRSNLVAASEEDLSPRVSSSPRAKRPGCPPGGEKRQSSVSRKGVPHSSAPISPATSETGDGKEPEQGGGPTPREGDRDPDRGGQGLGEKDRARGQGVRALEEGGHGLREWRMGTKTQGRGTEPCHVND